MASASPTTSWLERLSKRLTGGDQSGDQPREPETQHRVTEHNYQLSNSPDVSLPVRDEEWLVLDLVEMETAFANGTDRVDGVVMSKRRPGGSARTTTSSPSSIRGSQAAAHSPSGSRGTHGATRSPKTTRTTSPSPKATRTTSPSPLTHRKTSAPAKSGHGARLDVHAVNGRTSPRSASPHRSSMKKKPALGSPGLSRTGAAPQPGDEGRHSPPPDTSNFSKVRDTLRIKGVKKKKKKGGAYSVPQYSSDVVSFDSPGSKYDDPFEAAPSFLDSTEERRPGQDHCFEWVSVPHNKPEYCDHCGDLAWGFHRQVMKCSKCDFVVHRKCEQKVVIDCSTRMEQSVLHRDKVEESAAAAILEDEETKTKEDLPPVPIARSSSASASSTSSHHHSATSSTPSSSSDHPDSTSGASYNLYASSEKAKLARRIRDYNRKTTPVHHIHIKSSHTPGQMDFHGFVRVHMCVQRPIHVSTGITRTSWYRLMRPVKDRSSLETDDHGFETAFYLPTDTNRLVHIANTTTTKELIQILLKKFCVTDNPKKFSLYEEYGSDSRRLFEDDCPLVVVLEACGAHRNSKLVLRDNTYQTIVWDAFSLPELTNFIQILQREEDVYAERVKDRFKLWKSCVSSIIKERCMEGAAHQTQLNVERSKSAPSERSTPETNSQVRKESVV